MSNIIAVTIGDIKGVGIEILINSNVKDIEKEFIAKYSDHYNLIF